VIGLSGSLCLPLARGRRPAFRVVGRARRRVCTRARSVAQTQRSRSSTRGQKQRAMRLEPTGRATRTRFVNITLSLGGTGDAADGSSEGLPLHPRPARTRSRGRARPRGRSGRSPAGRSGCSSGPRGAPCTPRADPSGARAPGSARGAARRRPRARPPGRPRTRGARPGAGPGFDRPPAAVQVERADAAVVEHAAPRPVRAMAGRGAGHADGPSIPR
jgi:hypothetical protein